jgi:hypothetical protein
LNAEVAEEASRRPKEDTPPPAGYRLYEETDMPPDEVGQRVRDVLGFAQISG